MSNTLKYFIYGHMKICRAPLLFSNCCLFLTSQCLNVIAVRTEMFSLVFSMYSVTLVTYLPPPTPAKQILIAYCAVFKSFECLLCFSQNTQGPFCRILTLSQSSVSFSAITEMNQIVFIATVVSIQKNFVDSVAVIQIFPHCRLDTCKSSLYQLPLYSTNNHSELK